MTFAEYEDWAATTDRMSGNPHLPPLAYYSLGLAGEAGEAADQVKKLYRNDNGGLTPERAHKIALELGDVLWYMARTAHRIGYNLTDIAQLNRIKLTDRIARDVKVG